LETLKIFKRVFPREHPYRKKPHEKKHSNELQGTSPVKASVGMTKSKQSHVFVKLAPQFRRPTTSLSDVFFWNSNLLDHGVSSIMLYIAHHMIRYIFNYVFRNFTKFSSADKFMLRTTPRKDSVKDILISNISFIANRSLQVTMDANPFSINMQHIRHSA